MSDAPSLDDTPTVDPPQPLRDRIGDYELLEELARGGMGIVYRAYHPKLEREVALKTTLSAENATERQIERFQIEARAAARLSHPNLITIHEVGEADGIHFIAMDLIEGESLQQRLRRDKWLEPRAAAALAETLARALACAHKHAILHRDMKPANILLRAQDGTPVITDFGLAKDVLAVESGLTRTGQMVGTPAYMPPEQAMGDLEQIDRRADVYSLGATLYEALAGEPPFRGDSTIAIIQQVVLKEPRPITQLRPEVDADLNTICLKCLEKSPARRYTTAQALADDLERYLAHQPILARPPTALSRVDKWYRRNRALANALALFMLLTALALPLAVIWNMRVTRGAAQAARVDLARAAERDALASLAEARAATQLPEPEQLGRWFQAHQQAQRWWLLSRNDGRATEAVLEAALNLGAVAQELKQWELAAQVYTQASELDPPRLGIARRELTSARHAERRQREADVEAWLARARDRELSAAQFQDALFALTRYPDAAIVDQLVAEVERSADTLHDVLLERYLAVLEPEDATTVPELTRAIQEAPWAWLDLPEDPLHVILRQRIHGELGPGGYVPWLDLTGLTQRGARRDREQVTLLACQALGRLPALEQSRLALTRYLDGSADTDAEEAVAAATALVRLSGQETPEVVLKVAYRFGYFSNYARRLQDVIQMAPPREPTGGARPARSAAEYVRLGHELTLQSLHEEALAAFEQATVLEPDNGHAWVALGLTLSRLAQHEQALAAFDHAVNLGDGSRARLQRGNLLLQLGRLDEAGADLERCLREQPDWSDALVLRAQIRSRAGGDPLPDLERALAVEPDDPRALHCRVRVLLGRSELAAAEADARRLNELRPESVEAPWSLALVRQTQGRIAEAIDLLNQALRLEPTNARLLSDRSHSRQAMGDSMGALEDATAALEHDARLGLAYANRAQAELTLGMGGEALRDFEQFLTLASEPGSEWARHPAVPYARSLVPKLRAEAEQD